MFLEAKCSILRRQASKMFQFSCTRLQRCFNLLNKGFRGLKRPSKHLNSKYSNFRPKREDHFCQRMITPPPPKKKKKTKSKFAQESRPNVPKLQKPKNKLSPKTRSELSPKTRPRRERTLKNQNNKLSPKTRPEPALNFRPKLAQISGPEHYTTL